jgi:hypothetical protein
VIKMAPKGVEWVGHCPVWSVFKKCGCTVCALNANKKGNRPFLRQVISVSGRKLISHES